MLKKFAPIGKFSITGTVVDDVIVVGMFTSINCIVTVALTDQL